MNWTEALLLVITYCTNPNHTQANKCRNSKVTCIKSVTQGEPEFKNPSDLVMRQVYLVSGCLDNDNFKPTPVPPEQIKPPGPPEKKK